MRLFKKKALSADQLREIAETTLRHRAQHGWLYRDGVIDEAVQRASRAKGDMAVIDAIEAAFIEYELGNRNYGHPRFVA